MVYRTLGGLSERDGAVIKREEAEGRERARLISQQQASDKLAAVQLMAERDQIADRHAMVSRQSYVDKATAHIVFEQRDAVDVAWSHLQTAEEDATAAREVLEEHQVNRPNKAKEVKVWAKLKAELDAELLAFSGIVSDRQVSYNKAVEMLDLAKMRAFDTLVSRLDAEIESDLRAARAELATLRDQYRRRKAELDAALDAKAKKRWELAGKPFKERRVDQRPTFDYQAESIMQQAQEEQQNARRNA